MDVLIVDFNDSFTHNLAALCTEWGIQNEVVSYEELSMELIHKAGAKSVIWGPGPGHPEEYEKASRIIEGIFNQTSIFQLGICLGHQLILKSFGHKIDEAPLKRHGLKAIYKVPEWSAFDPKDFGREIEVQYYSSLCASEGNKQIEGLEVTIQDGVIDSSKGANHLSFQFHPESVGTSCPEVFFYGWRKTLIQ